MNDRAAAAALSKEESPRAVGEKGLLTGQGTNEGQGEEEHV